MAIGLARTFNPAITACLAGNEGANLSGTIRFQGTAPQPLPMRMDAEPACSKLHSGPTFVQQVQVSPAGGLKNVFVWVKGGLEGKQFDPPATPAVLDQKGCVYEPRVMGIQVGQRLRVLNSDPTTHNVHPIPRNNPEWNLSQAANGAPITRTFPNEEVMVRFMCNIHPWMRSYVGVVAHPYFAVTSEDGTFEIKGLPPGEYTIEAWHERLRTREQKVTVGAGESKTIEFTFTG